VLVVLVAAEQVHQTQAAKVQAVKEVIQYLVLQLH
jgi:hypothetical protein